MVLKISPTLVVTGSWRVHVVGVTLTPTLTTTVVSRFMRFTPSRDPAGDLREKGTNEKGVRCVYATSTGHLLRSDNWPVLSPRVASAADARPPQEASLRFSQQVLPGPRLISPLEPPFTAHLHPPLCWTTHYSPRAPRPSLYLSLKGLMIHSDGLIRL